MNNTTYEEMNREFTAAEALPAERAAFIRKTYVHLAGAILVFGLMTTYLVGSGAGFAIAQTMLGFPYSWLVVLGLFMGVSWIAQSWAMSESSKPLQYMGLALFTVAESIIFLPLLFMASSTAGGGYTTIAKAGVVTLGLFLGLTAVVFITRKDFFIPRPDPCDRRVCCAGFYSFRNYFRILAGQSLRVCNGCICRRSDFVRNI